MRKWRFGIVWIALILGVFCQFSLGESPAADKTSAESAEALRQGSAYGVCAHIATGDPLMAKKLAVMNQAGIRWARADFSWSAVERPQGTWRFEAIDQLLDEAEKNNVAILPILDYDVPWARPAFKNLDAWTEYVRQLVTRYKDRLRFWEVWNEPNLTGFWQDTPSGANYAVLLKATYETIKKIDPELTVVYAGLAGVPFDYFEESLKAGAGDYFDVMNIHPYRGGLVSMTLDENFAIDIRHIADLMDKYDAKNKPIWITEMGWASLPRYKEADRLFLQTTLPLLLQGKKEGKIAMIDDPAYLESSVSSAETLSRSLPKGFRSVGITLDELAKIQPDQFDALFLPPGESFPSPMFDAIRRYVEGGGSLILTGGVPLYYEVEQKEGRWAQKSGTAPEKFRQALKIGWRAWWTDERVPKTAPIKWNDAILEGKTPEERAVWNEVIKGGQAERFLTDRYLADGDEMIPLLSGATDKFSAPAAAIYRFDGGRKGNILVSTLFLSAGGNVSTVEDQAIFLPQAILIARGSGIEKFFWYEFQAPESDPSDKESFFGMVHADLSPKPAYIAYKTLIEAAPDGSTDFRRSLNSTKEKFEIVDWKRPDGKTGIAVWTPGKKMEVNLTVSGKIESVRNHLGEPVTPEVLSESEDSQGEKHIVYRVQLSPSILYFIGSIQGLSWTDSGPLRF